MPTFDVHRVRNQEKHLVDGDDYNLYCVIGCNFGYTIYANHIKTVVGVPAGPKVVVGTLTNTSMTLAWEPSVQFPNIEYRLQWRYAKHLPTTWAYALTRTMNGKTGRATIENLTPYTAYVFRIEWVLVPSMRMSIYSEASAVITTEAYGPPPTACIITHAMAISGTQISVTWWPPKFTNGPIIAYQVSVTDPITGHSLGVDLDINSAEPSTAIELANSLNTGPLNYIFNGVRENVTYHLKIVPLNNFGVGVPCERSVRARLDMQPLVESRQNLTRLYNQPGRLFIASEVQVGRRNVDVLLEEEIVFHLTDYTANAMITGMAVHVEKNMMFVADSGGTIRRLAIQEQSVNHARKLINGTQTPSHLSVDWLNDKLYFVENNQIVRLNLEGEAIEVVVTGFRHALQGIKVDPYNGYIYWLADGVNAVSRENFTGLYRLDLAEINEYHTKVAQQAQLIFQAPKLRTFLINYSDYRIYLPANGKLYAITIDGKIADIQRENLDGELVNSIENMVLFNQRFCFTHQGSIVVEDFHQESGAYFHSTYNIDGTVVALAAMEYKNQPHPLPLNPVCNVQAVFLDKSARIYWEAPENFDGAGRGAWRSWSYDLLIAEAGTNASYSTTRSEMTCEALQLEPDTEYLIKVRAISPAGTGPWSEVFRGRTFKQIVQYQQSAPAAMLIATDTGLVKTDMVGGLVQTLINRTTLMNENMDIIQHIVAHEANVFITSAHAIHHFDLKTDKLTRIANVTNVMAVNVEPLARKIYWSAPSERMVSVTLGGKPRGLVLISFLKFQICRANYNGSQVEILALLTYAELLTIDPFFGMLYWSNGNEIHFADLNGRLPANRQALFRANAIKSLFHNYVDTKLYFVAEHNEEAVLYRGPALTDKHEQIISDWKVKVEVLGRVPSASYHGPVFILEGRILWRDLERRQILINDFEKNLLTNFATVKEVKKVYAFTVINTPSLPKMPKVVPEAVARETVRIDGTWDNISIMWEEVELFGRKLVYDILVELPAENQRAYIRTDSHYVPNDQLLRTLNRKSIKPNSKLVVGVRAFTKYGSSAQVLVAGFTPSAVPSAPRNVRVYIYANYSLLNNKLLHRRTGAHHSGQQLLSKFGQNIFGEARWDAPQEENGEILNYTVSLIKDKNVNSRISDRVIPNQLNYRFEELKPNSTYHLMLRASTLAGEGPPSAGTVFNTFVEQPPARLLLLDDKSIQLTDLDNKNNPVTVRSISPLFVDYIYNENVLYYVEEGNYLKRAVIPGQGSVAAAAAADVEGQASGSSSSSSSSASFTLIASLPEFVTGLSIDWIGRRVYLSTLDVRHNRSTIWYYDHATNVKSMWAIQKVVNFEGVDVQSLRVDPLNSMLIWTETSIRDHKNPKAHWVIRKCRLSDFGRNCEEPVDFFSRERVLATRRNASPAGQRGCNCTYSSTVAAPIALDFRQINNPKVVYFDRQGEHFVATDMEGCWCTRLTAGRIEAPRVVTMDSSLYWMYTTPASVVNHKPLDDGRELIQMIDFPLHATTNFVAYNVYNQPYPDAACLVPHDVRLAVSLIDSTASSLTLMIDAADVEHGSLCDPISMATPYYRIKYRKHYANVHIDCRQPNVAQCRTVESSNRTFTIGDLDPFTNYTFLIEVDNYYQQLSRQLALENNSTIDAADVLTPNEDYHYYYEESFIFATAESRPGAPKNVRALVETPELITITWEAPDKLNSNEVSYEVRWYSVKGSDKSLPIAHHHNHTGVYSISLDKVRPGTDYNVSVRAYAVDNQQYTESDPILVHAFDEPSNIIVHEITSRSVLIKWTSPGLLQPPTFDRQPTVQTHRMMFQGEEGPANWTSWTTFLQEKSMPLSSFTFNITGLRPNNNYRFQLFLTYTPSRALFKWPRTPVMVTTEADVPEKPTLNDVVALSSNLVPAKDRNTANIFKLTWEAVRSNSPDGVVHYALWAKKVPARLVAAAAAAARINATTAVVLLPPPSSSNVSMSLNETNHRSINPIYGIDPKLLATNTSSSSNNSSLPHSAHHITNRSSDLEEFDVEATYDEEMALLLEHSAGSDDWKMVYNGTDTYWIINSLPSGYNYIFRLSASNPKGDSAFSVPTSPFYLPYHNESSVSILSFQKIGMLLLKLVIICIVLAIVALIGKWPRSWSRKCSSNTFFFFSRSILLHAQGGAVDVEDSAAEATDGGASGHESVERFDRSARVAVCAERDSLPAELDVPGGVSSFVIVTSNMMITLDRTGRREISPEDLNGLNMIDYADIERGTLLGSGQFGSIYEGVIKSTEQRVAIKVSAAEGCVRTIVDDQLLLLLPHIHRYRTWR